MSSDDNKKGTEYGGEILFSTKYYDVILLDEPIVLQPSYELAAYGLLNKMTLVLEIELCVLPAAINTAKNFSAALEQFFPTPKVRDTLSLVGGGEDQSEGDENPEVPETH